MTLVEPVATASIPAGWERRAVRAMGDTISGKALDIDGAGKQRPYLRTKNVYDGYIDTNDVLTMPMTDAQFTTFRLNEGDVLLNEGQSIELVGRCAIYRGEYTEPCAMQNQLLRFRAYNHTSSRFASQLFRYCQQTGVFAQIAMQTTSIAHLGLSRFETLVLSVPARVDEQEAIANALDDADAWIESLEQLIAKKRAIMQGAIQELLAAKQPLYGQSRGWKRSEIGRIPADWETLSLGQLFAISGGVAASRDQLSDVGIPYLHYGDIHTSASTFVSVDNGAPGIPRLNVPEGSIPRKSILADGDIVFVDASEDEDGVSKCVVVVNSERVPFVAGLHTVVAKPTDRFDALYGRYCFQSSAVRSQFRYYAAGMKVFSVSKTNLKKIIVPVPSLEEQHAIGFALSDMESEIDALEAKLAKARDIKQGMMQDLLAGRVRLV